jgi:hypothetical protein
MKIRLKYLTAATALLAANASAATLNLPVVQDGWIGTEGPGNPGATVVQGGGVSTNLTLATPNPSGAAQYTRKAWFGFDITAIKALGAVNLCSANITFKLNSRVASGYNGNNAIRFYGVLNGEPGSIENPAATDIFEETTTTWNSAPGNLGGNVLDGDKVNGSILGDVGVPNPAANGVLVLSGQTLIDFINADTNNFITVAATYMGQDNTGFGDGTGLNFIAKEGGVGSAVLSVEYQTGPCPVVILANPQPVTAYAGATAQFSVQAGGTPAFSYQWLKGVDVLSGKTDATLTIPAVQTSDAGNYSVRVSNAASTNTSASAGLTVITPAVANGFEQTLGLDGPLGYWRLNETGPVQDIGTNQGSSGLTGYGTYIALPAHQQTGALVGSANKATKFNGTTQALVVPYTYDLNQYPPFTVECWAKADSVTTTLVSPMASLLRSGNAAQGWIFYMSSAGWNFRLGDSANNYTINITGGGAPAANTWYHVAGTYDGSIATLYVNGVPVVTGTNSLYEPNSTQPLGLGARGDQAFRFPGTVDEAAVYNSLLTPADIAAHYQNGTNASPAVDYSSLVLAKGPQGYWRLDEAFTTPVLANNGTLGAACTGTPVPGTTPLVPQISLGAAGPQPAAAQGFEAGNKALSLDGATATVPALNVNGSSATITAWINPSSTPPAWAGIFYSRAAGTTAGLHFGETGDLRYTWAGGQYDWSSGLVPSLSQWTFVALCVEPTQATIYIYDGTAFRSAVHVANHAAQSFGGISYIGRDPNNVARSFLGLLDEVAVFKRTLSEAEVIQLATNAKYGSTPPSFSQAPAPQDVFPGETAAFRATATGSLPLTYQWNFNGTPIPGATGQVLTLTNVQYSQAGAYGVTAVNSAGSAPSPSAALTVAYPNPLFCNLTNSLVLHLPFDGNWADTSGLGNNATPNFWAPEFVAGRLGGNAIKCGFDTNIATYRFAQVFDTNTYTPFPALQFGTTVNFSVTYWARFTGTPGDLPFIGTALNSWGNQGLTFAPSYGAGGWSYYLGGNPGSVGLYGAPNSLNDGNWHHLVHTFDRTGNGVTYLDGVQVDSRSISGVGDLDNSNLMTIGQDPSGAYNEPADFEIDDIGMWRTALSSTQARCIYRAAQNANASFNTYGPVNLQIQQTGGTVQLVWQAGTLEAADTVNGAYLPVPGASAPFYQVTPGTKKFYRVKL